jgi:Protein of unknown function (DUF2800)
MSTTTEVKAHAKLSASGSERWLNCPASVELCERAPKQRESEYATEGTTAHTVLETILKNHSGGKPYSAAQMLKSKYPDEMVAHALQAYKEIEARLTPGAILLSETRVDLTFVGPDMFGTADCSIVEEFGKLQVIDYKYGAGVAVDPEENTQLLYYALGIAHLYNYNFTEVVLTIIQPRAPHERGPVREWVISIEELLAWKQKFIDGVARVNDPLADYKAGDWCRWCPGAVMCPAIKDRALNEAQVDFNDDMTAIAVPDTKAMTVPHLNTILSACDKLETWIGKVREHAFHVLEHGGQIDGWKLVQKRSIRKWTSETAPKIAKKKFGDGAFTEPELLSPAQLEKAFPHQKTLVADFIKSHASDISSGLTLVPESDKRPATTKAQHQFDEVPDQLISIGPQTIPVDEKFMTKLKGKGDEMATKKKAKVKTKAKTKKTNKRK